MENKDFIENSELRIAICDDDKSDREKVHILLQDYLKKKSILLLQIMKQEKKLVQRFMTLNLSGVMKHGWNIEKIILYSINHLIFMKYT